MTPIRRHVFLAAFAVIAVSPAIASEDLARKDGCTACHSLEKRMVGPGFKEIAARYRGDAAAEDQLVVKVKKGGAGVWGRIPMPPSSPPVKDDDVKILVKWILLLDSPR